MLLMSQKLKNLDIHYTSPGKILKLTQLFIVNNLREMHEKGIYLIIPKSIQKWIYNNIWNKYSGKLKPAIIFILKILKRISSKPLMRAMSTVDHKRIRVMYLMFSLCARLMRV